MDADALVAEYLDAVRAADTARMLALFAPDGVVHSPLYGDLPATEFYPKMFGDTRSADLTLLGTTTGTTTDGRPLVMFLFKFDWVLKAGEDIVAFDVVDVAELDADGKITALSDHLRHQDRPPRLRDSEEGGNRRRHQRRVEA